MRTYKTINGLLKHVSHQISIKNLFSGVMYSDKQRKVIKFTLSDELQLQIAQEFADYVFMSKTAKNTLINRLIDGHGDLSCLQCFYLNQRAKGYGFSNSLSGEAFRHCIREFCKYKY